MKRHLLFKSLLLLCALIVGTNAWAEDTEDITFDATSGDGSNVSWSTGDNSASTKPTYNSNSGELRLYPKCYITISSTTKKIAKVDFTYSANTGGKNNSKATPTGVSVNTGTIDDFYTASGSNASNQTNQSATWTASDEETSSFTITVNGDKGNYGFVSAVVTFVENGGSSVPSSAAGFTVTAPSINFPAQTTYSQAATTASGYTGTVTYEITANTAGATLEGTTLTVTQEGSVTVKATAPAITGWAKSEATYTLTVNDTREAAGLAFTTASYTKTWGEEFTGQALTNPHTLPVTWSSTDETVASVNALGEVTMLKAGTTTIKATFAGDNTYKNDIASYTLTINKAPAVLSYTTTSFDIMLNDNTFEAPALNNPNNLTVTYASNNTNVATVNTTTGVLAYVASAVGTAKITASFAGDERYYPGSANYTINIIDPTVKGSKYNPYTVAEVIAMAPSSNSTPADGQSDIYVIGYIVGEYRNPTAVNTTVLQSDFTTDANIAIADDPTTTALASSVPVNLTKTADKNSFGNNTNKGKTIGYKVLLKGDVLKYFGMPGLKNIDEISAVSLPATLNAYGYATFASSYALDFSDDSEYSAWQISSANSSTGVITFSQITGTVAAGTGVLLKGTASSSINIPVAASGSDISSTNKLVGITTATAVDADAYYGLSGNQFKKVGAGTVPAGKALLPATEVSGARELTFVFDEATGIKQVETSKSIIEGIYNLAGQKVQNPTKGLYIMNGKKVIIK